MSIEDLLPVKIAHNEFVLESIGTVIVSTIQLPVMYQSVNPRSKYETAIIWDQKHPTDEGFHIDWVGFSRDVALDRHELWCCPTLLAQLIHTKISAGSN